MWEYNLSLRTKYDIVKNINFGQPHETFGFKGWQNNDFFVFLTLKLLVPLVVVTSHTETLNYDSLENDTEVVDPEFSGTSYDLCYFLT